MHRIPILLALCWVSATLAQDGDFSERVRTAMEADIRSEAETERDRNRRPVETLAFFGIEKDMRVLELIPGGGWYTKLLAPALADGGHLYLAIGTGRVAERLLDEPGFDQVTVLAEDVSLSREEGSRFYTLPAFSLGVENLDAALTFRNLHNFTPEGRRHLNEAVFQALKPGGIYGVVDHSRRHMEPANPENGRRLDPVLVIEEMLAVGFEFDGYSDLHYRPDDELRYEVGRHSVTGNTDRFTLKFRKPE